MDHFDIEASLRRVDKKFTEDMTSEEKRKAIRQFKRMYAEQMGKLAGELSKRAKVQENLYNINQKQKQDAKQIDEQLRKRMEKHDQNRQKVQEGKLKQYKMFEENWKRKFEEIVRKNRNKQRQAYQKAEKMRKDAEQYFNKKHETMNLRENNPKEDKRSSTVKPYTSLARQHKIQPEAYNQQYTHYSKKRTTFNVRLPNLNQTKINQVDLNDKAHNRSIGESTLNDQIRSHQERSLQGAKEQQADKIKKYLEKLEKIQKTRKKAQEKMEKEVQEAKKMRQLRENPQVLEANRKRSLQQLEQKRTPRAKKDASRSGLNNSRSRSKTNLNASIYEHLQSKKRLQQMEFDEREIAYEQSKQKIKQTKINRLVKEAINMLKHQTLNESLD